MGHSLLTFQSNAEIDKEDQLKKESLVNAELNEPALLNLASYVEKCWIAARDAKTSVSGVMTCSHEERMLKNVRQNNGDYDPDKLAKIRKHGGSTIYMLLTSMKTRAAAAWLKDVLLPAGEKPWSIDPSKEPKLPNKVEGTIAQGVVNELSQKMIISGSLDTVSMQDAEMRIGEVRDEIIKRYSVRAKAASARTEKHIEDQLITGGYYKVLSKFIDDITVSPTAFIKGPIVKRKKMLSWGENEDGSPKPIVEGKFIRTYSSPSCFDIYPSPSSKNVNDGYLFERHFLRRSDLNEMIGVPGFKEEAIRSVLVEYGAGGLRDWLWGDKERSDAEGRPRELDSPDPDRSIEALEFWGKIQGSMLIEFGIDRKKIPDPDLDYEAVVWKIGTYIISARLNPHPLGLRPYYGASYSGSEDSFWNDSVCDLMRDIQDFCNATARAIVNNMALASGPQVDVAKDRIDPGEDIENIWPWKIWRTKDGAENSGKPAVNFYQPKIITNELMKVYEYFFRQASEVSGIPAYIYGSSDVGGAGKTASGLSMLLNAASKTLKLVITNIDTKVIKESIYNHWVHLMLFDKQFPKGGDIDIVARASEYLVIQEQLQIRRQEFLTATANPIDLDIMGKKGRAAVLREQAKGLKINEDVVPSKKDFEQAEAQQGGVIQPGPGQGEANDQGTPKKPASLTPAGGRAGVMEG